MTAVEVRRGPTLQKLLITVLDVFLADLTAKCAPAAPEHQLVVFTAPLTYRGPDILNVTRKSGGTAGTPFAPSWNTLRPALESRKRGVAAHETAWANYVPAYYAEMLDSYTRNHAAWASLLARPRVVLACYCTTSSRGPLRCHRTLLADILRQLGADTRGELGDPSVEPLHGGHRERADVAAACGVPTEWVPEHHAALTDDEVVDAIDARVRAERAEQAFARSPLSALVHTKTTATIMVDDLVVWPNAWGPFLRGSCHLTVNGPIEALHAFAAKIGLKRAWFRDHPVVAHYDLTPAKRLAALRAGAVEVSGVEQARRRHAARSAT